MCEPTHSIVQFPDEDDGGNPTEPRIDALPTLAQKEGWWTWAKKKIGRFFHLSKLGNGHSETLTLITPLTHSFLPIDTKYEALWWDRTVHLDGTFHGPDFNQSFALECATDYANRVSIGNLTLLRQFIEGSMKKRIVTTHTLMLSCVCLQRRVETLSTPNSKGYSARRRISPENTTGFSARMLTLSLRSCWDSQGNEVCLCRHGQTTTNCGCHNEKDQQLIYK